MDSKRLHFILWHKLCHTRLKTPIFALVWHTIEDETAPESRPAICEPQPSPRPCQNRAWHRAKSARRRNNNIYRRTSKTHTAHVLVIRPHEHTMLAQALAAGKGPLMNPPNLTSPLPGLASPAGPAGNERITTTCLVSDCTAISQLWQTRTRSRYAGKSPLRLQSTTRSAAEYSRRPDAASTIALMMVTTSTA